jgi:probable HAF family extracellular repeat protein
MIEPTTAPPMATEAVFIPQEKNMQRVQDKLMPAASATWQLLRLPLVLVALAAAGAAVAQQAQLYGTADGATGGTYTTYRVINLSPSVRLAAAPDINARGQVTFAIGRDNGGAASYYYDGTAVLNIGTLGGNYVVAADLNDPGQIVGGATTESDVLHAFLWNGATGILDISGPARVGVAEAEAINNQGVITGGFGFRHAFRWAPGSGLEDLGVLTPGGSSTGLALNEAGEIAGMATTPDNRQHAFIWTRSGGMVDIDTLNSYGSMPVAVGARGEVAGNRAPSISDSENRAFLWTPATGMFDIGSGGGAPIVLAMTPGLHMAGFINFVARPQQAMSWTPATGTRNLGTLGGQGSRARDVNNRGQLVGFAENKAGKPRAFIWTARQGMLDLNRFLRHAPHGLVLDDALAINDSGAIVATSNAGLVLLRPEQQQCGCGHALGPVVAPAVVKAGVPLQASVTFVDEDRAGTRSVTWSWGDGSGAQAGRMRESGGAGNADASHSFAAPGIYTVTATVTDRSGRSTAVSHDVVVTGPSGGTVAGAGTLMSPVGAFAKAPLYAGRASFRLIAPTNTTALAERVPSTLQFNLPGLDFRSQDFRLLGSQGSQQVFEGSGTVGGAGGYKFRLSTSASLRGQQGGFVLKIWHTDAASRTDVVDYDNARAPSGSAAGRVMDGSIVLD